MQILQVSGGGGRTQGQADLGGEAETPAEVRAMAARSTPSPLSVDAFDRTDPGIVKGLEGFSRQLGGASRVSLDDGRVVSGRAGTEARR